MTRLEKLYSASSTMSVEDILLWIFVSWLGDLSPCKKEAWLVYLSERASRKVSAACPEQAFWSPEDTSLDKFPEELDRDHDFIMSFEVVYCRRCALRIGTQEP